MIPLKTINTFDLFKIASNEAHQLILYFCILLISSTYHSNDTLSVRSLLARVKVLKSLARVKTEGLLLRSLYTIWTLFTVSFEVG